MNTAPSNLFLKGVKPLQNILQKIIFFQYQVVFMFPQVKTQLTLREPKELFGYSNLFDSCIIGIPENGSPQRACVGIFPILMVVMMLRFFSSPFLCFSLQFFPFQNRKIQAFSTSIIDSNRTEIDVTFVIVLTTALKRCNLAPQINNTMYLQITKSYRLFLEKLPTVEVLTSRSSGID